MLWHLAVMQMFRCSLFACCILAGSFSCSGQTAAQEDKDSAGPSAPAATVAGYVPLTQGDRFHRYLKSLYSPEALLRSAAGAGLQQATNTPSEWGQGAEGYFRRYFRSKRQGFGSRTFYAAESTFLAHRPDGTRRLSYSRIVAVVAGFISREWQPRSADHIRNAFGSIASTAGSEVGFNVVREFLPRFLHH